MWVFEPTLGVDQRIDDNYRLGAAATESIAATRAIGTLGLSRESQTMIIRGLLQADGAVTFSDARDEEQFDSNQSVAFDAIFKTQRSEYGSGVKYTRDKPTQNILSDITESSDLIDTGEDADTERDIGRETFELSPNATYELSRRSSLEADLTYRQVEHELSDPQDALLDFYTILQNQENQPEGFDPTIPLDQVTYDDVPVPFTLNNELDNYREAVAQLGWRYKLSPISNLILRASYIDFTADTEADPSVVFPFEDKVPDDSQRFLLRDPTRESRSETVRFTVGYDLQWSPTLSSTFEIGAFRKTTDDSDLLRPDDETFLSPEEQAERIAANTDIVEENWLANATIAKRSQRASYRARLGFDLRPNDLGREQQALDLRLTMDRELSRFWDFSFQVRAYDPDAGNKVRNTAFERRFLSLEPRLTWELSREWSLAVAYQYRRQRSAVGGFDVQDEQGDAPLDNEGLIFATGESNSFVLSVRWAPPSRIGELRDTF